MKTNKLPQKQTRTLNHFRSLSGKTTKQDTDTTTTILTTITSTHIFNK
jgi:hypothetical protein